MASASEIISSPARAPGSPATTTAFIDRWIYVFMAGMILTIVLVGFIPDSFGMLAAIKVGQAPPIPPILHVHAVLMASWILLLLTQSVLMATGRPGMHMQLGLASLLLAPAIVMVGLILVPTRLGQFADLIASAPPDVATQLKSGAVPILVNLMLLQIRLGIAFPILVGIALYLRRKDSNTHKRLMILATIAPLPAAIARIHFLPNTLPASPLALDLYQLLVISPMFLWDVCRRRQIQSAYVIWLAAMAPATVAVYALWNTPWWLETGSRLVGMP